MNEPTNTPSAPSLTDLRQKVNAIVKKRRALADEITETRNQLVDAIYSLLMEEEGEVAFSDAIQIPSFFPALGEEPTEAEIMERLFSYARFNDETGQCEIAEDDIPDEDDEHVFDYTLDNFDLQGLLTIYEELLKVLKA